MSASLLWRPITPPVDSLDCWAPSHFIRMLSDVLGDGPWRLAHEHHGPLLQRLATEWGTTTRNPFRELATLLAEHDAVEVWAEY